MGEFTSPKHTTTRAVGRETGGIKPVVPLAARRVCIQGVWDTPWIGQNGQDGNHLSTQVPYQVG